MSEGRQERRAASRLRHALAVSHAIAPFVEVGVPQAIRWLPATGAQPHGGVLCDWIEGSHLSAATNPGPVAAFLRDLHVVDRTVLRSIVVPYGRWRVQQIDLARRGLAVADR